MHGTGEVCKKGIHSFRSNTLKERSTGEGYIEENIEMSVI